MKEWNNQNWEYFEIQKLRDRNFQDEWPTITEFLQYTVERFPENIAFTRFTEAGREDISYRELAVATEALAMALRKEGLVPGDKVVISGKNSPDWGIVYLAVLCAGCVAVPLDARQTVAFHQHLIEFSEAKAIFMDGELLERLNHQVIKDLKCYQLQAEKPGQTQNIRNTEVSPGIWSLIESQKNQISGDLCYVAPVHAAELAVMLTTSGTTGQEKVAMLSHANFTSNVIQCVYPGLQEVRSSDRFYLLLPLHHSYPMTAVFLEGICHGSQIIFPSGMAVQQIIQDMKNGQVTVFMGIPLLFNKIIQGVLNKAKAQGALKHSIFQLLLKISSMFDRIGKPIGKKLFGSVLRAMGFDHVRILICGAGALMPEVGEKYRQLGLDFLQGYGLTEAAPIVTLNPAGSPEVRSVGRLLPMIQGRLEKESDAHQIGELCIDGPNKMLGYYKNPSANRQIFTEDGFLRTGDLGYFDDQGYFYITGRSKNVIVSANGKNIYPEEIEELFQLCDCIEQVMVRGYIEGDIEKVELVVCPRFPEETKLKIEAECDAFRENSQIEAIIGTELRKKMLSQIRQVDSKLPPYQKISRVRVMAAALEATTTQKIRRFLVEDRIAHSDEGILIEPRDF